MNIIVINTHNALANLNYCVFCPQTRVAAIIDPFDATQCVQVAKDHDLNIQFIINTHAHGDHTAGNRGILEQTQARCYAHPDAHVPGQTDTLAHGEILRIGQQTELTIWHTPGHTQSHICLYQKTNKAFFCGDTLFNAGCGNCHNGGNPEDLYQTFKTIIYPLTDTTQIYPGHDYRQRNLHFTLSIEKDNVSAKKMLAKRHDEPVITTIADEKQTNLFFRLHQPSVIAQLSGNNEKQRFISLRKLRDNF